MVEGIDEGNLYKGFAKASVETKNVVTSRIGWGVMHCLKVTSYAIQPKWVSDIVNSNTKWKSIKSFLFKKLEIQIDFLDNRTLHSRTLLCFSHLLLLQQVCL